MGHSYETKRTFDQYPPTTKKGRPAEHPYSPGSERPHRSSSRSSRHSTRSAPHHHRYEDMGGLDKSANEQRKRHSPQAFIKSAIKKGKSAFKQQSVMDIIEKDRQGFERGSTDSIQNSMELVRSNGFRRPMSPVGQAGQPTTDTTINGHPSPVEHHDRDQPVMYQVRSAVSSPSLQLPNEDPDNNMCHTPRRPELEESKELPPIPPPHQTPPEIPHRVESSSDAQDNLKLVLSQQQTIVDDLNSQREALSQQVQDHKQEIAYWKNRTIEAASKNVNITAGTPLSLPESELLKDWKNLAYEVKSFVTSHFDKVSTSRLETWAKENGRWLEGITPSYQQVVKDKRSGPGIIEAAIWYALCSLVFGGLEGHCSIHWAGHYQKTLRRLVNGFSQGHTKQNSEQFVPLFHQWGALTANLIATIQPNEHHDHQVRHVVQEFEEYFASCRYGMFSRSDTYRRDLRVLIEKAVKMDFSLSGQTSRYIIHEPPSGRYNVVFDEETMQRASRSPSSRNVRFMLQPCLFRAGGQGESYDTCVVIDQCTVWML